MFLQQRLDRALKDFNSAIDKSPVRNPAFFHAKGVVLHEMNGRCQHDFRYYVCFSSCFPFALRASRFVLLLLSLCLSDRLRTEYEEALVQFETALSLDREFVPSLYHMGLLCHALGRLDAAVEAFSVVVRWVYHFSCWRQVS